MVKRIKQHQNRLLYQDLGRTEAILITNVACSESWCDRTEFGKALMNLWELDTGQVLCGVEPLSHVRFEDNTVQRVQAREEGGAC